MSHSTSFTYRPIFRDPFSGVLTELPSNVILDIAGVENNTFTVAGKAVMLADGTTSNGDPSTWLNLQAAYNNTDNGDGKALIQLESGRDFILQGTQTNQFVHFESDTGNLIVSGNLVVSGESTIVDSVVTDYDHILLSPDDPTTSALRISYDAGVTPSVPYMEILDSEYEVSIFSVDSGGATNVQTLRVSEDIHIEPGGLIDGVSLSELYTNFSEHLTGSGPKHGTTEINLDSPLTFAPPEKDNVQLILEFFDSSINTTNEDVNQLKTQVVDLEQAIDDIEFDQALEPKGYTHIQDVADVEWTINHNRNTTNFTFVVLDEAGNLFHPDSVSITDMNTFKVRLNAPERGQVNMIFYVVQNTPS